MVSPLLLPVVIFGWELDRGGYRGLNHLAHDALTKPDNGYQKDKDGNIEKISNEGGDEVDILYDEKQ
ncbi:hypothetical protein [Apibacter adventoris]|uniref:hypothetical protein n=1 Tax=Apibacter adventoris TaxID=1679466 RepID=UPI000CF6856C|nr:hypothetical protein [Apibacter adventoris]PQL94396.1 hypothetical protein C4S76_05870 [Apibacter adventoris]